MYQGAKTLPHSNVQWHYYDQSDPASINPQSRSGTVFVDGRQGTPRVYIEDREVTNTAGNSLMWIYNVRYQLKLGTVILEETNNPHSIHGSMSKVDGLNGMDIIGRRSKLDLD
jgi:hypothetical protein